ncbi:hypothetical protein DVB69_09985 [Sporosarcina sp. BI001-red]|uniref:hypothetical protein n=1 Tax=Sporosarcina sp. BI001-red TaxID=2282866 RepID=UPI000E287C87|nr:hypothetical protein [Sporosarcina sp. BI001-red]REB07174.1 hypothetical protein DVB69_09985 [Sporosarcina sp. BI001-red]
MLVDINLLPEKEKERSGLLYVALAFLGAALLFWLIFFLLTRNVTSDTERLDTQLEKLQLTQSELTERLNRSDTAQSHDQLEASVQWVEDYRYETAPLLEDLVSQLPRRGFFRSFAFAAPHQATVEIQFDDKTEAAYYLTRMLSSEFVETASIESIESEEIDQEEGTASNWLPRYLATYTIFFTDGRQMIDGAAPPVPSDTAENSEAPANEIAPPSENVDDSESTVPEEEGSDAESN